MYNMSYSRETGLSIRILDLYEYSNANTAMQGFQQHWSLNQVNKEDAFLAGALPQLDI